MSIKKIKSQNEIMGKNLLCINSATSSSRTEVKLTSKVCSENNIVVQCSVLIWHYKQGPIYLNYRVTNFQTIIFLKPELHFPISIHT